jgi:penicillin-binding protein 1A
VSDLPPQDPFTPPPQDEPPHADAPAVPGPTPVKSIRADLEQKRERSRLGRLRMLTAIAAGAALTVLLLGVWVWKLALSDLPKVPDRAQMWSMNRPPGVSFLDREGRVIAQRGFHHGAPVELKTLPPYVAKAFLAAEDRRFYSHFGVDPVGVARAMRTNFGAKHVVEGGSTLTQQVAREVFLNGDQNMKRKAQEAVLALELEHILSKDEILSLYLNRTYFGAGAFGVEAASQTYFGKSAKDLSLSEAALLASLPKAPTRLDPSNDLNAAIKRSHLVLERMKGENWLTDAELKTALAAPPKLAPESQGEGDFGYVLDLAQAEARKLANGVAPDLVVRLTIDPYLQAQAVKALRTRVDEAKGQGVTEGAIVALGPDGDILALAGGLDHRESAFNRATQARRQPGSSFKPFVYAAALEAGVSPEDARPDAPVHIGGYSPSNSDGVYRGNVTLTEALTKSINSVAVRLAHEVGPDKVSALARRFGVEGVPEHPSLPIALGAYEVSLVDMAGAYQVFQSGGKMVKPWLISQITTARGDLVWRRNPNPPVTVYSAEHSAQMIGMMRQVIESPHGTGRRARLDRPAAGKTGTSQMARDAWFIGFTPDLVCAVWIGDDMGHPMRSMAGGDTPALIWKDFMTAAHQVLPPRDFGQPAGSDPRASFYSSLASDFHADGTQDGE